MHKHLLTLALLFTTAAQADYAWLPDPKNLQVRAGVDILSSSNNFADDGVVDPLRHLGQLGSLQDFTFWVRPEFAIDEGWALGMLLPFTTGQVTSTGTQAPLAAGSGLGDLRVFVKWQASEAPLFVLESEIKFPSGVAGGGASDLAVGQGNLDLALKAHWGHRAEQFYFSASPGLLLRTGGYSPAATLEVAMQAFMQRIYLKLFFNSILSFSAQALTGGNLAGQTVPGSGGTYARLAGSPTGLSGGGSLGLIISRQFRLEGGVQRAILGARYPEFLSFTINLLGTFDLSSPDYRPKVREVPFENETLEY